MFRQYCDHCMKRVRGNGYHCPDCGSDTIGYHKACLKKINQSRYCPKHSKNHVENGLIISYLKTTWRGLNLGGELSVRGLLDGDSWSEVYIKFPEMGFTFRGAWDPSSKTLLLKPGGKEPVIHRIRLHHHAGFRKALKAMLEETITRYIAESEKAIKTHEREIKGIKRTLKKEHFLSDIFAGRAEWPKPKPEPELIQEPPPPEIVDGTN